MLLLLPYTFIILVYEFSVSLGKLQKKKKKMALHWHFEGSGPGVENPFPRFKNFVDFLDHSLKMTVKDKLSSIILFFVTTSKVPMRPTR